MRSRALIMVSAMYSRLQSKLQRTGTKRKLNTKGAKNAKGLLFFFASFACFVLKNRTSEGVRSVGCVPGKVRRCRCVRCRAHPALVLSGLRRSCTTCFPAFLIQDCSGTSAATSAWNRGNGTKQARIRRLLCPRPIAESPAPLRPRC